MLMKVGWEEYAYTVFRMPHVHLMTEEIQKCPLDKRLG